MLTPSTLHAKRHSRTLDRRRTRDARRGHPPRLRAFTPGEAGSAVAGWLADLGRRFGL